MSKKKWIVYLVRCSDKSLYCGISNDFKSRLIEHNLGKGAKYTKSRRPVELVGISPEMTKSEALKLEYRIKQLPADKKIAELARKENQMTIYKKDLQAINKDVKAFGRKMGKLIKEFDKSKKAKVAKKATAKPVKAKTTK
jgi:putative endonuclease